LGANEENQAKAVPVKDKENKRTLKNYKYQLHLVEQYIG
jgi:hypothetical protein